MGSLWVILSVITGVLSLQPYAENLVVDYFTQKGAKQIIYLTCESQYNNTKIVKKLNEYNIRTCVSSAESAMKKLPKLLYRRTISLGILLDGQCNETRNVLLEASRQTLLDDTHSWLILHPFSPDFVQNFQDLNMSIDADVMLASYNGEHYELTDLFNFGRIQGNALEIVDAGTWTQRGGLNLTLNPCKYYDRWNFHNFTFRAISVIAKKPEKFHPDILSDVRYQPEVSPMTKVAVKVLNVLLEHHNFTYNYTIVDGWIGNAERNSTVAVTNSLLWREQDIACTCVRMLQQRLDWMDMLHPPPTSVETKFFYLIPNKGIGNYENRFLTPMSPGVWWSSCLAGVVCVVVLAIAAIKERRAEPGQFAFFSVVATMCQQDFEDVQPEQRLSSQGRRMILLAIGLMSMLLYNFYTSSVVSWLLNAASPTIVSYEGLINSDLELVFEDVGYTRAWLERPGKYYYTGYKNVKEDELREKKVTRAKRTMPVLMPVEEGLDLIRKGAYAYHTEPYTAGHIVSRTFSDRELCDLSAMNVMAPAAVYIMAQKNSPYKEFFVWRLQRLSESGHMKVARHRIAGVIPPCSGNNPRALALGQAAPAFLILLEASILSLLMLALEILWHRWEVKSKSISKRFKKQ